MSAQLNPQPRIARVLTIQVPRPARVHWLFENMERVAMGIFVATALIGSVVMWVAMLSG